MVVAMALAVVLTVAGCGQGDKAGGGASRVVTTSTLSPGVADGSVSSTTSSSSSSTSTTSTSVTTASTAPTSATATAGPTTLLTAGSGSAATASGSGCAPPPGDTLPSGRWFGFVIEAQVDQVSFDLACWFSGSAAVAAAAEDGEQEPPPNDYYIRNQNGRVRILPVGVGAGVAWLPIPGDPESLELITYNIWRAAQTGREVRPGVWLNIDGAGVVSIEEQYVP